MTQFIIEKRDTGITSHTNIDADNLQSDHELEVFDSRDDFESRLSELQE